MENKQLQYIVPVPVIIKRDKILLVFKHQSSAEHCMNKWQIPGSRASFGQTFEDALKANTRKLLGVDIEVIKPLGFVHSVTSETMDGKSCHFFVIPAICKLRNETFSIDRGKLREARWFSYTEIEGLYNRGELVDEGDLKIADMALNR